MSVSSDGQCNRAVEGKEHTQTQLPTFLKSNTGVTHLPMTEPSLQIGQFSQQTICLPTFFLPLNEWREATACVLQAPPCGVQMIMHRLQPVTRYSEKL